MSATFRRAKAELNSSHGGQRDLLEVSEGLRIMDNDALSLQMRALVDTMVRSVATSRIEELLR